MKPKTTTHVPSQLSGILAGDPVLALLLVLGVFSLFGCPWNLAFWIFNTTPYLPLFWKRFQTAQV
jgi:hypothetical protein